MDNKHLGNYFIVGMPGDRVRADSWANRWKEVMIEYLAQLGLHDPVSDIYWTKVPAWIPEGGGKWQNMGGDALAQKATVVIHCCDGKEVAVIKPVNPLLIKYPELLHTKGTHMMLPTRAT